MCRNEILKYLLFSDTFFSILRKDSSIVYNEKKNRLDNALKQVKQTGCTSTCNRLMEQVTNV